MSKGKNAVKATEQKGPRIIALDLLRGYFLVSIILNHLQWYPNLLDWVAIDGALLVSAAEGFFLISGILLGIVRGRNMLKKPFRDSALLVLRRGLKLYVTTIVLMLAFTFIGWLFLGNAGLKPGIRPIDEPLYNVILGGLSLQYLYGWADFLRLYAIFLIMAPLALWLLRKGKWYIVIAASCAIWAFFPTAHGLEDKTLELLMPISWQLIFFVGLTIGYHWVDVQKWWQRQTNNFRRSIKIPVLSIATITLLANIVLVVGIAVHLIPISVQETYNTQLATTFNKEELTIPRLTLFALWFTLGLTIFMRYEAQIRRWFGWILMPFGTNSLYVYIMHAIVLFFAHLVIAPDTSTNVLVNFVGSLLVLGLIFIAVKTRFLFKVIPR